MAFSPYQWCDFSPVCAMASDAGGAASPLLLSPAKSTGRKCDMCLMPFNPRAGNPGAKFCSMKCKKLKNKTTAQQPTRHSLRRKNSLNNSLPGSPQQPVQETNENNGTKRPHANSPSEPSPQHKKGKVEISSLLSNLSQVNLLSLDKPNLLTFLNSCISCLVDLQEEADVSALQADRIRVLEDSVQSLKAEIVDIKVAFADKALANIRSAGTAPTPSYADSVRGSVLVASFAEGERPVDPINVATVEKLIDTKSNGLVPQSVRAVDNNVYIRFNDTADVVKAASIFKKQSDCSRIFKTASPLEIHFPVVAHNVDVADLKLLQSEIEYRNPLYKDQIHSLKLLYTRPKTNCGHVKILLRTRQASQMAIRKGTLYCSDGSHRVVEPDLNREVRRCYNCQRYGHTQFTCTAKLPACGKCAGHHRTKGCDAAKTEWKCVNCSGQHQTGDKKCIKQIAAVERYRTFLER